MGPWPPRGGGSPGPHGSHGPHGPQGGPKNLEPQKPLFRKIFQCLGTNGHPIAPKILKTRHSKFLKGLIQQRSTLGAKNRFFFDFFVKYIFNKKIRKIGSEKSTYSIILSHKWRLYYPCSSVRIKF